MTRTWGLKFAKQGANVFVVAPGWMAPISFTVMEEHGEVGYRLKKKRRVLRMMKC